MTTPQIHDAPNPTDPLVRYLVGLAGSPDGSDEPIRRPDRAALAALRRGLGKEPASVVAMFPLVEPRLKRDETQAGVRSGYIVASLFALHPRHRSIAGARWMCGLGAALAPLRRTEAGEDNPGVERRFIALLDADGTTLPEHLRHMLSLLRSQRPEATIDYQQLRFDIQDWGHPSRFVQQAWAAGFWRARQHNDDASPDDETSQDGSDSSS